jgi:hypothetical protein
MTATLHDSDFVNRMQPKKPNKLPLWRLWDKNHLTGFLKIHSLSKIIKILPIFVSKGKTVNRLGKPQL